MALQEKLLSICFDFKLLSVDYCLKILKSLIPKSAQCILVVGNDLKYV